MKKLFAILIILGCTMSLLIAQPADTEINSTEDYKNWGWTSIVQKNDLITVATVPDIGARIMQYDLADHASIFINPDEFGNTYEPKSNSAWPNFGGYKTWPAPQAVWNWPPPPILDFGQYESEIVVNTPDSTSVFVRSGVEKWKAPDVRFERTATIYKGSSRVRMVQTIINEGSSKAEWSVWDVTQAIVNHPGEQDFENFWVYFPLHPNSTLGSDGVRTSANSSAWVGEVAPGIFGVQFKPENKKIFADAPKGWICYVDELAGKAYAKTFQIWEGADYPDENGRVQVWISGGPLYLEVEVVSPIVELEANGGRYTFIEDWYATTLNGPILDVNPAGAVADKIARDRQSGNITCLAGVFHIGTAKLMARNAAGATLDEGQIYNVTPLEILDIDEALTIPDGAARIDLVVFDSADQEVGVLTSSTVEELTSVNMDATGMPESPVLLRNYPNPFNPATTLEFKLQHVQRVRIGVYDATGRLVDQLADASFDAGDHQITWQPSGLAGGIYVARLEAGETVLTQKLVFLP